MERRKNAGIDLEWNYSPKHTNRFFRLSIQGYIEIILIRFGHKRPAKPQLLPHKHCEIHYVDKVQLALEEATIPSLDAKYIKRVQAIVGAVLFYVQSVYNKLFVALNSIGTHQSSST